MLSQPVRQFFELKISVSCLLNLKIVAFANSGCGHILTQQVTSHITYPASLEYAGRNERKKKW